MLFYSDAEPYAICFPIGLNGGPCLAIGILGLLNLKILLLDLFHALMKEVLLGSLTVVLG